MVVAMRIERKKLIWKIHDSGLRDLIIKYVTCSREMSMMTPDTLRLDEKPSMEVSERMSWLSMVYYYLLDAVSHVIDYVLKILGPNPCSTSAKHAVSSCHLFFAQSCIANHRYDIPEKYSMWQNYSWLHQENAEKFHLMCF